MEHIFYFSNAVGANLLADAINNSLTSNQSLFHGRTLSQAINHLKDHLADSQKIIISDDFFNDFTKRPPTELKDFIELKEKLDFFINSEISNSKWCFLIDMPHYIGDTQEFISYCKNNNICLCTTWNDITEFMEFITGK